jgi:hypothetical protein
VLGNFIRNLQGKQDIFKRSVSFQNENVAVCCKATSETVVSCISICQIQVWGTRWRSLLKDCAASLKVVVSIPYDVIGIPASTMALGLTQLLT